MAVMLPFMGEILPFLAAVLPATHMMLSLMAAVSAFPWRMRSSVVLLLFLAATLRIKLAVLTDKRLRCCYIRVRCCYLRMHCCSLRKCTGGRDDLLQVEHHGTISAPSVWCCALGMECAGMLLRALYWLCGTDTGYAATHMMLCFRYALCSTGTAYAATHMMLGTRYAQCGTDRGYGATLLMLGARYAQCGIDRGAVLTEGMVLRARYGQREAMDEYAAASHAKAQAATLAGSALRPSYAMSGTSIAATPRVVLRQREVVPGKFSEEIVVLEGVRQKTGEKCSHDKYLDRPCCYRRTALARRYALRCYGRTKGSEQILRPPPWLRSAILSAYARAMQSPVLTSRMVVCYAMSSTDTLYVGICPRTPYEIPGTYMLYDAICLRASSAVSLTMRMRSQLDTLVKLGACPGRLPYLPTRRMRLRARHAMSGTNLGSVLSRLRARYGKSGTDLTHGAIAAYSCCAISGTDIAYGPTRPWRLQRRPHHRHLAPYERAMRCPALTYDMVVSAYACYAQPGTDVAYGATPLRARYTRHGTEAGYGRTS
eukprot:2531349-Rhodomonas_salina.1